MQNYFLNNTYLNVLPEKWSFFQSSMRYENLRQVVKPVYYDHRMGYFSAFWGSSRWPLDELQKAEIVSKSKLVPSVLFQTHYGINHR